MKSTKKTNSKADDRFESIASDPKFRRMPTKERKVGIDDRFKGMIEENSRFALNYKVDKRGRPVKKVGAEDLKKYYRLEDEDEKEEEASEIKPEKEEALKQEETGSDNDDDQASEDSDNSDGIIKLDLARGDGNVESSSDSDSEDSKYSEDDSVETHGEHNWGEMDGDARIVEEATSRLAVCNMNWDRIKAKDLLVLFNSFKPPGGIVSSVKIFPSEFGIERMAEEEKEGPRILKSDISSSNKSDSEVDFSGNEFDDSINDEDAHLTAEELKVKKAQLEKVRKYQLERLRYYYAVVDCDSFETANTIYDHCNNMEYETSATRLDLRFIPEGMTFEHAPPKDVAAEVGDLSSYEPRRFDTNALKMASAVNLTWEETDPERLKLAEKAFDPEQLDKLNLRSLVASDSDESSDNDEKTDKYKALLDGALKSDPSNVESVFNRKNFMEEEEPGMEIQWESSGGDKAEKTRKKTEVTPFQNYLEKRKEKRKERKAEIKRRIAEAKRARNGEKPESDSEIVADPTGTDNSSLELLISEDKLENLAEEKKRHFNLKKLMREEKEKKKLKKKGGTRNHASNDSEQTNKQDEFQVNLEDKRFSALYSNHLFNIDPTDPNFKKTAGMERIKTEKVRRAKKHGLSDEKTEEMPSIIKKTQGTNDDATELLGPPGQYNVVKKKEDSMELVTALKMKTNKWNNKKRKIS